MVQDRTSAAYWAYHIARTTFFAAQSVTGLLAQSLASGSMAKGEASFVGGKVPIGNLLNGIGLVCISCLLHAFVFDRRQGCPCTSAACQFRSVLQVPLCARTMQVRGWPLLALPFYLE